MLKNILTHAIAATLTAIIIPATLCLVPLLTLSLIAKNMYAYLVEPSMAIKRHPVLTIIGFIPKLAYEILKNSAHLILNIALFC